MKHTARTKTAAKRWRKLLLLGNKTLHVVCQAIHSIVETRAELLLDWSIVTFYIALSIKLCMETRHIRCRRVGGL